MERADFLVLGAGFGGSLLAMILAKKGHQVAVVDVAEHPRFAIGESTTPLGDLTLQQIAVEYDLPELRALTAYGSMREQVPGIRCGRKRGFTYFGYDSSTAHSDLKAVNRMLVSASESDVLSDTHWMRSDVDQYFLMTAMAYGVRFCLGCEYELSQSESDSHWRLQGTVLDKDVDLSAEFLVDGSGAAGKVLQVLQIGSQAKTLSTSSQAVYGHFRGLKRFGAMLHDAGVDQSRHPYSCDDAATHHVLKDGWMWQLPFDDGTASVGMVWDTRAEKDGMRSNESSLESQWLDMIRSSPVLKNQFEQAQIVRPETGLISTGRLQRLADTAAGKNWAALPLTAGFIDPLHSTGIAHTLFGIRRLAKILLDHTGRARESGLANYSKEVITELRWIDELVECCYESRSNFQLWACSILMHFCAVTSQEKAPDRRASLGKSMFLNADDLRLRDAFRDAREKLGELSVCDCTSKDIEDYRSWLRQSFSEWNSVGLFREDDDLMYASTAVSDAVRKSLGRAAL